MDRVPLLLAGRTVGELTASAEPQYTVFEAGCALPDRELYGVWAVGTAGEVRLGVLEPEGRASTLRRRFSRQMTAPLGRLLRGEVRSCARAAEPVWTAAPGPERLFRSPLLRERLTGVSGALTRTAGSGRRELAVPCDPGRPFPLPFLFCFARGTRIDGTRYLLFRFDGEEWPVMW